MAHVKSLHQLLAAAGLKGPSIQNPTITGLQYDSRKVSSGNIFFAMKGVHVDGHKFIDEVIKKGVVAVLSEKEVKASVPVLAVPNIMETMSKVAAEFYDYPSKKIPVIGITGTNGKTTTTYLIEDILRAHQKSCGVIGTINYRLGKNSVDAPNTTPFSVDVQKFLFEALQEKAFLVAMEVSSHALAQKRVDDVQFSVGVFTNLTQDHLDFHKTMENYYQAKKKLFVRPSPIKSVINIDDSYGLRLSKELSSCLTYGFHADAQLKAGNEVYNLEGIEFSLTFPSGKKFQIKTNLMGHHNISNCLSAAGALLQVGFTEEEIVAGLNRPHSIPGRLERVEAGQKFVVVVDYAHTEDALKQVLTTLKATGPRRLISVFGAGGDRDKTKRPKMGRIAAELSDFVFVTSDNPRSENPQTILSEIEGGIKSTSNKNYEIYENRETAIEKALSVAKDGDIVLIAGKGHETYQIYGNTKSHFSDQETALKFLKA